jgi:hypothetical protein
MTQEKEYFIMYQIENTGQYVIWSSKTEEIETVSYTDKPKDYCYDMLKYGGHESTPTDLKRYVEEFKKCKHEILNNNILRIDWLKYYDNSSAVKCTFKRLAKGKYEHHKPITRTEYSWMIKSHNGALTYCKPETTQSYGYDYSAFYPRIFSSKTFMIPTSEGKEVHLTSLPDMQAIQMGYYRVMITCTNPEFRKVFSFSKEHTYLDKSLYQAMKYQKIYDVQIQLIIDDEPNAYLYDKCESGYKIFGNWYTIMMKLRAKFPKNMLIKHLTSSLSGHISSKYKRSKTYDEIIKEKLDVGMTYDHEYYILKQIYYFDKGEEKDYYRLLNTNQPYHYNIRLMPFLTAAARNKIARLAAKDIDNVVRIHTDCVVFSEPQTFGKMDSQLDITTLKDEDKTTGLIQWKNINTYYNYTDVLKNMQLKCKKLSDAYRNLQFPM